jgi:hypothetical protein
MKFFIMIFEYYTIKIQQEKLIIQIEKIYIPSRKSFSFYVYVQHRWSITMRKIETKRLFYSLNSLIK